MEIRLPTEDKCCNLFQCNELRSNDGILFMGCNGIWRFKKLEGIEVLGIQSYTLIPIKRTEQSDERNAVKSIQNFEF